MTIEIENAAILGARRAIGNVVRRVLGKRSRVLLTTVRLLCLISAEPAEEPQLPDALGRQAEAQPVTAGPCHASFAHGTLLERAPARRIAHASRS